MVNLQKYVQNKKRLKDPDYMKMALEATVFARSNGDFPVAAVLVWENGKHLIEHDTRQTEHNPLRHAVINLLEKAVEIMSPHRLKEATLYVTLEPDIFCISAIKAVGLQEVVFGAYDDKNGFMSSRLLADHTLLEVVAIGGVLGQECVEALPESVHEHVHY